MLAKCVVQIFANYLTIELNNLKKSEMFYHKCLENVSTRGPEICTMFMLMFSTFACVHRHLYC